MRKFVEPLLIVIIVAFVVLSVVLCIGFKTGIILKNPSSGYTSSVDDVDTRYLVRDRYLFDMRNDCEYKHIGFIYYKVAPEHTYDVFDGDKLLGSIEEFEGKDGNYYFFDSFLLSLRIEAGDDYHYSDICVNGQPWYRDYYRFFYEGKIESIEIGGSKLELVES